MAQFIRLRLGGRFSSLPVGFGAGFYLRLGPLASCGITASLRLPAWYQTLHSPLFLHTEPAPQQKFPAIRSARGITVTLIARQIKINVDYHDDDDDSLDPPVNFEVSTQY